MSDLSDVSNALVTLIASTLYPNGTGQPSVVVMPCVVYAGWPIPQQLDADLLAGKINVSVFPTPTERNTTRYPMTDWQTMPGNKLSREIRRQERLYMVTVWADTPAHRDAVAQAIDPVLAVTQFLTMPDGFGARLVYHNTRIIDDHQKSKLYRRDLNYSVEYATTETVTATPIVEVNLGLSAQVAGTNVPISTITTVIR